MFSITSVQESDIQNWNSYVEQHSDATPYHSYAWLQAVKQAYNHDTLAWVAQDDNKNIVGVLAAAHIKPPMSNGVLSALPFCDVGGVLANNDDIAKNLLQHAHDYCQSHNIETFEHRQSAKVDEQQNEIEQTAKVRMLIEMPETSEVMFAGFKSKLRSQIRKAEKNGLTASIGTDKAHLDGFYQVFARNMRDLGSPVHSKAWFEAICKYYKKQILIANVYKDEQVVGAGIVLLNGEKACIPWASTNADFNRLAPNMLLYWTLLAKIADSNVSTFDFGRSTLGEGTYKFKQQWGATPLPLDWQDFHFGQLVAQTATGEKGKARTMVENIWKKLPVDLTVTLGPKIRKYISL